MRRSLSLILIVFAALLISGCGLIPELNPPAAGGNPGASAAEDGGSSGPSLQQPNGVVVTFLDAWEKGNYEDMYSLLSAGSQAQYTLEEFTNIYRSTAQTMTLIDFTAEARQIFGGEPGSTGAQVEYVVTYNTNVLGELTETLRMPMTFENDRWAIVWDPSLILDELAGGNTLQLFTERPSRANIYDIEGDWLVAANSEVVTLQVETGAFSEDIEGDMLALLSEMLRLSPERIRSQYAGFPEGRILQLGDMDLEVFEEYRSRFFSYPALSVSTEKTGRRYYNNGLAAHVIGYTGFIQAEQCPEYQDQGYSCDEIIGQAGLEQWGEEYLAGSPGGTLSVYTPSGGYYGEVTSRDPEPAQSLYLTIDRDLQAIVEEALVDAYTFSSETWALEAGGAAVVVLDVKTGAVRAMASYPTFDPNVFHPYNAHPFAEGSYIAEITNPNDPLRPLFNRAAQGQQPPGSVFKIVSAAAALEHPNFGMGWTFTSTGTWTVNAGGSTFTFPDWAPEGHGTVNLAQALTVSCNSCFYQVGYTVAQEDLDYLTQWARAFHLGEPFGLPIAEAPGNIPDPSAQTSDGRPYGPLDVVNNSIGQGDVLLTPLQVAVMTAAVANGGTIYQPYFVDRIGLIGEDPTIVNEPEVIRQLDVAPEHLAFMREGMREVVVGLSPEGTAEYRLGSMQIPAAGKTGTGQVSSEAPPNAWFTGFVPYDEPELAIVVLVENGGQGSVVASPIFRRIVEEWYDLSVLSYPRDWGDPDLFDFENNRGE